MMVRVISFEGNVKINNNFSEIYTKLGGDSTALTTKISFGDGM